MQIEIPAKGHTPNEDDHDCTTAIHCSACGAITTGAKAEHAYGEWAVTREPTSTENGSREKVCSICGDKATEMIPATGKSEASASDTPNDSLNSGKKPGDSSSSSGKNGCSSSIAGGAIGAIALISVTVGFFLKKKED